MENLALRISNVLSNNNPYTFDECFESVEECKNVYLGLLNEKEFETIIEDLETINDDEETENIIEDIKQLKENFKVCLILN